MFFCTKKHKEKMDCIKCVCFLILCYLILFQKNIQKDMHQHLGRTSTQSLLSKLCVSSRRVCLEEPFVKDQQEELFVKAQQGLGMTRAFCQSPLWAMAARAFCQSSPYQPLSKLKSLEPQAWGAHILSKTHDPGFWGRRHNSFFCEDFGDQFGVEPNPTAIPPGGTLSPNIERYLISTQKISRGYLKTLKTKTTPNIFTLQTHVFF